VGVIRVELFVDKELPGVDADEIVFVVCDCRGLRWISESVILTGTAVSKESSGRGGRSGIVSSSSDLSTSIGLNARLEGPEYPYSSFEGLERGIGVDIGLRAMRN
jgi:hypothetical protein